MAKWLVSGWTIYPFLVTPEEWARCLAGFHCVIHNAHVPQGYRESSREAYLDLCRKLFDLLAAGEKLVWKTHYPLLETQGLTTDLGRCRYGHPHQYQGEPWQRADFDEPCVSAAPFTLTPLRDKNGKTIVSTRISYSQYPENVLGWEISYPKKIQFWDPGAGDYGPLRSVEGLDAYQDFLLLKGRIQAITRPLALSVDGREVRTRVRISEAAQAAAGGFRLFQQEGISL